MGGLVEWVDLLWVGSWLLHYVQVMKQNLYKWIRENFSENYFRFWKSYEVIMKQISRKRSALLCVTQPLNPSILIIGWVSSVRQAQT